MSETQEQKAKLLESLRPGVCLDGSNIELFRLSALRRGIKLEIMGMKRSAGRRSCYAVAKSELRLKGNRQRVLSQLETYIQEKKNEHNNNRKTNETKHGSTSQAD